MRKHWLMSIYQFDYASYGILHAPKQDGIDKHKFFLPIDVYWLSVGQRLLVRDGRDGCKRETQRAQSKEIAKRSF